MSPFDQMWEASRHNLWSSHVPWVLQLGSMGLVLFAWLPHPWLRRLAYLSITFTTVWAATQYSSLETEEKWRIRYQYAEVHEAELTEQELNAVTVDGANRLLGPLGDGAFPAFNRCVFVLIAILLVKLILRVLAAKWQNAMQKSSPRHPNCITAIK